jgi:WD40 repeat protein
MRRGVAILVLAMGCGRGLQRDPGLAEGDGAPPVVADAASDRPVIGGASPIDAPVRPDPAPDAGPADAPPADVPSDVAPPDVAAPPLWPASTTWKACGHLGAVWPHSLAHSPDGRELLVGYGDGSIDLFKATGGPSTFADFSEGVTVAVTFSADGAYFASLDFDGLRVWGRGPNDYAHAFDSLVNARTIRFSPTNPHLLLIAGDHNEANIQLWPFTSGNMTLAFTTPSAKIEGTADVTFTADGSALVYLQGKTLHTVGLDGSPRGQVDLGTAISGPVFSADASLVAGLDAGGAVTVLGVADGKARWSLPLTWTPRRLSFLFLGRSAAVLALGADRALVITDGKAGRELVLGHALSEADPSPDGTELAGVLDDGSLIRLSLADGRTLPGPAAQMVQPSDFFYLTPSPDGRYLAARGGKSVVWDLTTRRVVRLNGGDQADFSPTSDLVAASGTGCGITRLDDGSSAATPPAASCAYGLVFSPDGRRLAGVSDLGVAVFDNDGRVTGSFRTDSVHPALRFSPDGASLASSGHELWSTRDWSPLWQPDPALQGPPYSDVQQRASRVVFSPDGKEALLSLAYLDQSVSSDVGWKTDAKLVAVPSGEVLHDFADTLARQPGFSPDGAWITAGARLEHRASATVRALDPATIVSTFLPDGRIAGGQSGDVVTFYCPE